MTDSFRRLPELPDPLLCRGKLSASGLVWCEVEKPQCCPFAISFGYAHYICTHPDKLGIAAHTPPAEPPPQGAEPRLEE